MTDIIAPFPIRVADAELADLADRLARTRWPDAGTVTDGSQGPTLPAIRHLVERWQQGYDWRAAEALINAWGSSRTVASTSSTSARPNRTRCRCSWPMAGRGRSWSFAI